MDNSLLLNISNLTINGLNNQTVDVKQTLISGQGMIIILVFVAIASTYGYLDYHKDLYEHWKNPKGKEVNLVRLARIMLYAYTVIVIIALMISKYFLRI